jgi:16S rRNA processing protein RimM
MPPPAMKARPTPDPTARRVTLAVIVGAHGVHGEVRLKVFADDLAAHAAFNDGALTVLSLRNGSNGTIARFAEVADRTAAEALRGTELTVPRDALPPLGEGEYYHADLIGLPAVSDAGEAVGTVVAVDNYGAGDVLEIERPTGARFMVPMTVAAVPEWDAARLVVATPFTL